MGISGYKTYPPNVAVYPRSRKRSPFLEKWPDQVIPLIMASDINEAPLTYVHGRMA
jgi:hypothetical protein